MPQVFASKVRRVQCLGVVCISAASLVVIFCVCVCVSVGSSEHF